jgi:hypothetical protein
MIGRFKSILDKTRSVIPTFKRAEAVKTDGFTTRVKGHVNIVDKLTGEVVLDKDNAVHNLNMAIAIARGLSNTDFTVTNPTFGLTSASVGTHQIFALALGNGGSSVDSLNQITFLPPNVTSPTASLYDLTYWQPVDEAYSVTQANFPANSVTYQQSPAPAISTIVIVTATIAANQPAGEFTVDSPTGTTTNSQYAFDELGLFTADGLLLTHIIFSPILKTSNRELVITYTLTVSVS